MEKFQVDRKLDNKRIEISIFLIKFSFKLDYPAIRRERIQYISRSGYSLEALQKPGCSGFNSVSIEDIGRVITWGHTKWEIYCYEKEANIGLSKIINKITLHKDGLQEKVEKLDQQLKAAVEFV